MYKKTRKHEKKRDIKKYSVSGITCPERIDFSDRLMKLVKIISKYSPDGFSNIEKEIFKLKFIEGKTSKQIALELKLPIKKVYEATDRIKRKSKKVRNDDKN